MSFTPARAPSSSQLSAHKSLQKVVAKHIATKYLRPISDHNHRAFEEFLNFRERCGFERLILDSGCGVGLSTHALAQMYPDALVVGLDRSHKRLSHSDNQESQENCLFLRCDCEDFWRLLELENILIHRHYLLYPNPYPKAQQLNKRWHGHAVFPSLMAISPELELRSNWEIYVDEFMRAAKQIAAVSCKKTLHNTSAGLTAFERKYSASGHKLWRCEIIKNLS